MFRLHPWNDIMVFARPPFHFWENVKEVLDACGTYDKSIVAVKQLLAMVGYVFSYDVFQAMKHGVPQGRPRVVGVAVEVKQSGLVVSEAQALATRIVAKAMVMTVPALPLSDFLLPPDASEITRFLVAKTNNKGIESDSASWGKAAVGFCAEKGIPLSSLAAPATTRLSPWFQILCCREQQALLIFYTMHQEKLRSIDLLNTLKWMHPICEGGAIYILCPQ
jgi:hypothetical protein